MMRKSLGKYFLSNYCFEWHSFARKFALLSFDRVIAIFYHKKNSQGSVATRLKCGRILKYCFSRNLLLSLSANFENHLAFDKVKVKTRIAPFFRTCSGVTKRHSQGSVFARASELQIAKDQATPMGVPRNYCLGDQNLRDSGEHIFHHDKHELITALGWRTHYLKLSRRIYENPKFHRDSGWEGHASLANYTPWQHQRKNFVLKKTR